MRISDWSSDVCSSDLNTEVIDVAATEQGPERLADILHRQAKRRDLVTLHVDRDLRLDKRAEEHTSELQSLMRNTYAVFCLKKNKTFDVYVNLCFDQLTTDSVVNTDSLIPTSNIKCIMQKLMSRVV